ncbi:MAG: hypothetical protein RL386_2122 [Bacteroidota bacterium]|jgi:hypothetical protein
MFNRFMGALFGVVCESGFRGLWPFQRKVLLAPGYPHGAGKRRRIESGVLPDEKNPDICSSKAV